MKSSMKHWVAVCGMALAAQALAADFQQGMRLKADKQLEAASAEFEGVLQQTPQDTKALEQLAVIQGWLGRYPASIASWQRLLALEPHREDARVGIARIQYWSQQPQQALQTLQDVLSRQPRLAEALALQGDVLLALNRSQEARAAYSQALAQGADSAELNAKLSRLQNPKVWRMDVGLGQDRYNNTRSTENGSFLQLGYQMAAQANIYARIEQAYQFGSNDSTYFVGAYWSPSPVWALNAEWGQTPSPDFRPATQAQIGLEFLGHAAVQPLLSYRQANYTGTSVGTGNLPTGQGQVKTITPGLRLVWPGTGSLEVRLAISDNIDRSNTKVTQLRINLDTSEYLSPYLAYFKGEEALPPQPAASFEVLVLGAVYKLNDTWSLRADLASENRPQFYQRNSLALGVSYRF